MSLDLGTLSGRLEYDISPALQSIAQLDNEIEQFARSGFNPIPIQARAAADQAGTQMRGELSTSLDQMEADAESAGEDAGDGFGSKLKTAGIASVGLAAAAIGATFIHGLGEAMDREVVTDQLGAALGGSPAVMRQYGATAARIYADAYGENLGEVAEAVEGVAGAVDNIGAGLGLQRITEQALNLSALIKREVPEIAQLAQQMVDAGLAENIDQAFDLMLVGSRRVGPALRDSLFDALLEFGHDFSALGISGEQSIAALVAASEQGALGIDKAADSMQEFMILATNLDDTGEAYKRLGLDGHQMASDLLAGGRRARNATKEIASAILDLDDPVARSNMGITFFGSMLEEIGANNVPAFLRALRDGESALDNWEGANKRAGDALNDNARTNIEAFKRSVELNLVDFIGTKVIPTVNDLSTELGPGLGQVWQDIRPGAEAFGGWLLHDFLPGIPPALQTVVDAGRQFGEDFDDALADHPELRSYFEWLAEELPDVAADVIPAVADAIGWMIEKAGDGLPYLVDGVEKFIIGWTYVAEYGSKAAMIVLDTWGWALEGILNTAAATLGWIPELGEKIEDAALGFETFRDEAYDALNQVEGWGKSARSVIEGEMRMSADTSQVEDKLTRLVGLARGLRSALGDDRLGVGSSAPDPGLEGLLAGSDEDPKEEPGRRRRPGDEDGPGNGRAAPTFGDVYVTPHDYDDFRREMLETQRRGGIDGMDEPWAS